MRNIISATSIIAIYFRLSFGGSEQLEGAGGSLDCLGADLVGVGKGGHFAGHAAQAEARSGMEIGGLQPPVVEAEGFGDTVLKIKFAIIVAGEMVGGDCGGIRRIDAAVKEVTGIHEACGWSAGPPSSTKRRSQ